MKKIFARIPKRYIVFRTLFVMALLILLCAAMSGPVSAKTMKGYTASAKKVALYKNKNLKKRKAWINPGTELTISSVKEKYAKVSCKQKGKKLTGYIRKKDLFDGMLYDRKYASKNIKAYRKCKKGKTYGSVKKGSEVLILGTKGNFSRVIYSYGKGLRLGWVSKKDLETNLVSKLVASSAGVKTSAIGSPSQVSAMTSVVGSTNEKSDVTNLDGVWTIHTAQKYSYNLDIHGESKVLGGNLEIYIAHNGDNQKFRLRYLRNGYYSIQCVDSDLFLDVDLNTGNVSQWQWHGGDNQLWGIRKKPGTLAKQYYIFNKYTGYYLDNCEGKLASGNNVIVYPYHGDNNQVWGFAKDYEPGTKNITPGTYYLVSGQDPNFVMDVYHQSGMTKYSKFDNVQLCRKNGGNNQQFRIRYSGDGYYTLNLNNSVQNVCVCLTEENIQNHVSDNTLMLFPGTDDDTLFKFIDAGNGYYYIRSKYNGCYIDNSKGILRDENDLITYPFHGDKNQKWKLVPVS